MKALACNPQDQTVFISHGDCIGDAEYLAQMIRDEIGVKNIFINYIGPVNGAHSGPGPSACFLWERKDEKKATAGAVISIPVIAAFPARSVTKKINKGTL